MDRSTKIALGAALGALWVYSQRGRDNGLGYYSGLDSVPDQQMRDNFASVSRTFEIPIGLLVEICRIESRFKRNVADGRYGEIGVMQMKPSTAKQFGGLEIDLRNPASAIYYAGQYLRWIADLPAIGNDWFKVAQGYNGGPGHLTNPAKYKGPSIEATIYATRVYSLPSSDPHYFDIG